MSTSSLIPPPAANGARPAGEATRPAGGAAVPAGDPAGPAGDAGAPAAHRIASDAEALARAGALVRPIAAGAAERDRDRVLPAAEIELLSREGLLAITVPARFGGAEVSARTLAEVVRLLASADPNVAQIPHSHFVYLELVRQLGTPAQQQLLFGEVLAGRRLANAQSEARSKTIVDIRASLRPGRPGQLVLDGEKFYCTGSLLAHRLMVLAKDDAGRTWVAIVPADAPGVSVVDDWAGMGQRTTASGTVKLERVSVPEELAIPHHRLFKRPQVYGARAQLLHAAIDVGIACGALEEACELVRATSRPWFEAGVERACEDPLLIQRVGELEIDLRAARALLGEAARTIDEVERAGVDEPGSARASIAVAACKAFADRVGVQTASALFELCGTRSAAEGLGLHRHWRNARTHTLHDPVRWKLQHVGRYTLNGTLPPQHGQL
ncbi:MAG TPA: SfnB family sulfur acquisition oxidoreductase [Solirubrobacteraceae bacterium]|jgi:SfnB family sulfur acquisition oxidoreductase|nr:SfnB family sulfur acquisition oxidoreductase [Solirubrobacteraceae bacterium]